MDDSQRGSTYTARSIRIPVLKALLTSQILYVFVDAPNLMCDEANEYLLLSKKVRVQLNQNIEDAARDNCFLKSD